MSTSSQSARLRQNQEQCIPGSISRGYGPGKLLPFFPAGGLLLFFRNAPMLQNVLFQTPRAAPEFEPLAAAVESTQPREYIIVGAGNPTVIRSQPASQGSASAQRWRQYR